MIALDTPAWGYFESGRPNEWRSSIWLMHMRSWSMLHWMRPERLLRHHAAHTCTHQNTRNQNHCTHCPIARSSQRHTFQHSAPSFEATQDYSTAVPNEMTVICVVKSSRSIILKFPSVSHCIVSVSPVLKSFACKGQCTCPHSIKTCWMSISYMHIMFVRSIVSSLVCKGNLHLIIYIDCHIQCQTQLKNCGCTVIGLIGRNQVIHCAVVVSSRINCPRRGAARRHQHWIGQSGVVHCQNLQPSNRQNKSDQSSKDRSATAHQVWSFHGLR